MMPSFVVDLPGGGGKRLAAAGVYDQTTGISKFTAPGLLGEKGQRTYVYHDPKCSDTIKMEKEDQLAADEETQPMLHHDEYKTNTLGVSKAFGLNYNDPSADKSSRSGSSATKPTFPCTPPNTFDPTIWAPMQHSEVAPKAEGQ
jgi:hypothetical protein